MEIRVVGAGGLGSHVLQLLRSARPAETGTGPVTALSVIDCDRVESRNTTSQFHGRSSVGNNKAKSLQQTLQFLWARRLEAFTVRLTSANTEALIGGLNKDALVIDCLDNAETRRLVQTAVRQHGLACLHAGVTGLGADISVAYGRVVWDERFVPDTEDAAGAPTCQDGLALPFVGLVASWTAYAAQLYLSTGQRADYAVGAFGARRL